MRKASRNTKGFSVVELLIVIVVLAVVGGAGFFVYHRSHKTKTVASNTSSHQSSTQTSRNDSTSNSTTQPDKSVFKVPELGIEIVNVPTSLQDLTDATASSDASGTGMYFSTQSLTNLGKCAASSGGLGSLSRYTGTYPPSHAVLSVFVKQFDGFWIGYTPNRDQCWNGNDQAQSLDSSQNKAFGDLVTNAANIEAIQ